MSFKEVSVWRKHFVYYLDFFSHIADELFVYRDFFCINEIISILLDQI